MKTNKKVQTGWGTRVKTWSMDDMNYDAAISAAREIIKNGYDSEGFEAAYQQHDHDAIYETHGYYLGDLIENLLEEDN